MIFLHPLVLLGLAAAAIPAVLHLFQRRAPPEVEFPPIRYLSEAERRSARRLRLRHLLLLILRTALIVTLVLAAARPLVPTRAPGGTHPPTALVIVLDNSLSSGAVVGGQVTLDRLKAAARTVLMRASPTDRLWLMLADGVMRAGSRDELVAAVDSAAVLPRRLDLVAAVRRAARLVDAEPLPEREVSVISDLQRTAFGTGRADPPAGVRVLALAPAEQVPENRGIAAARVTENGVVVSVSGTPAAGPAPITLRLRGGERDVARALAAPGATVTLPLTPPGPGWWVGTVELEPDELRGDDRREIVWHTLPAARVDATPSAGPFVAAAVSVLRASGRVSAGHDVTIGDRPGPGPAVVVPPADPALVGELNRALRARGIRWQLGDIAPPGLLESTALPVVTGVAVGRRYRLQGEGGDSATVVATVNGEPWAVATPGQGAGTVLLGSRLDTAWTALPTSPGFVPFLDALLNRFVRGETPVSEREGSPHVEFTTSGADTIAATVYGPDPRESDLTPADPGLARADLSAEVLSARTFGNGAFAGARRADLSGILLMLALLLALGELAVATLTH